MEHIRILNSKKQQLAAIVEYPQSQANKLAVLCPGFLDTKDYPSFVSLSRELVKIGYTVVRFDPTGTWGSEGDISEYTTRQYLSDIKSVTDFMLAKGNYTEIILSGHSRGGKMSILYAARNPQITKLVAIMPSPNNSTADSRLEEWEKNGFVLETRNVPNSDERKEFKIPFSHVEDRNLYDVFKDVQKVHVPVLFVAGECDDVISLQDVKDIFEVANEPKEFILVPTVCHDYRLDEEQIQKVNKEIIAWLAK